MNGYMMKRLSSFLIGVILSVSTQLSPSEVSAHETNLETHFDRVHDAVITIRTFEHAIIAKDGIGLVPMTDLGSGVLISEEGDVVTAAHLIEVADLVQVEFADGLTITATVVAAEPAADLALLRLERVPEGVTPVGLGTSDALRTGEQVFIIGAPYGLSHTLTVGHVSARHAPATLPGGLVLGEFIQTDAAVNRGNSGGPMFNMASDVVGIVSHIFSRTGHFEGVGFAVSSKTVTDSFWAGACHGAESASLA